MWVNAKGYPDPDVAGDYVPPDEYLCKLTKITTGKETRNPGEEMWRAELVIVEGAHEGKKLFDYWVFNSENPATQRRQVLIQHRIAGLPKDFAGEIGPENFLDKLVYVTFEDDEFKGQIKSSVEFGGYRLYDDIPKGNIPF